MSYYTSSELAFNERAVKEAEGMLNQLENDLYEIDHILYEGIMGIGYAQGIDILLKEDPSIDLNKAEEYMNKIRANNKNAIDFLNNIIDSIKAFLMDEEGQSDNKTKNTTIAGAKKIEEAKKILPEDQTQVAKPEQNEVAKKVVDKTNQIAEKPNTEISPNDKVTIKPTLIGVENPHDKKDLEIVQPIYGSPVKPIYTNDDNPRIEPIPIHKKGEVNLPTPNQNVVNKTNNTRSLPLPKVDIKKGIVVNNTTTQSLEERKIPVGTAQVIRKQVPKEIGTTNTGKTTALTTATLTTTLPKMETMKPTTPIVQPVYGSPVKPTYTDDDPPRMKPIPLRELINDENKQTIIDSQKKIIEKLSQKKED